MNETEVSEYSGILKNYQFPEQMSEYLSNMPDDFQYAGAIDQEQFDSIIQWAKEKGQINKAYTYEELTDFSFVE